MIIIYKGDDTGGAFGKRVQVDVNFSPDIIGASIFFELCGIRREFKNVHSGDKLEIFYSHNETARLPVGTHKAVVWLVDPSGKIRTLDNALPVRVTTNLAECYGHDDTTRVSLTRAISFERLVDVPNFIKTINGNSADAKGNIKLDLAFVRSINGLRPDSAGALTLDIPRKARELAVEDSVTVKVFSPEERTNKANLSTLRVPFAYFARAGKVKLLNIWGADAGTARAASRLSVAVVEANELNTLAVSKNAAAVEINGVATYEFDPFEIAGDHEYVYLIFRNDDGSAATQRVGLVDVDPTLGFGIGTNGRWQDNLLASKYFAPILTAVGERTIQQVLDDMTARGGDMRGWIYHATREVAYGETASVQDGDYVIARGNCVLDLADIGDEVQMIVFTDRSAAAIIHKSGAVFLDSSDTLYAETFKPLGGYSYGAFFSVRLRRIGDNLYFIEGIN